jgi:putative iron-dependent peroxidase
LRHGYWPRCLAHTSASGSASKRIGEFCANRRAKTQQENVFGRSKDNDIEMPDDKKPKNSHSAVANVGDDFKIIRDNMPFGNMSTNEMGTYFIAYASTYSTVKKMLDNMFIGDPEGNYDRLLDFSTAKTGSLFFVPTLDMLDDFSG